MIDLGTRRYQYLVYDENDNFVVDWSPFVKSDPVISKQVNQLINSVNLTLLLNDEVGETKEFIWVFNENDAWTVDEDKVYTVNSSTRFTLGSDGVVDAGYRVKILTDYVKKSPILDEFSQEVLDEEGRLIFDEESGTHNVVIFDGYVSRVYPQIDKSEIAVTIKSHTQHMETSKFQPSSQSIVNSKAPSGTTPTDFLLSSGW